MTPPTAFRRPESVLVVVLTDDDQVLLLRRFKPFDFWQSVTGSLLPGESIADGARRELFEETGFRAEGELQSTGASRQYTIDRRWRSRFAPGITENVEYEFAYRLPNAMAISLDSREHSDADWCDLDTAIDRAWSWTNKQALQHWRLLA